MRRTAQIQRAGEGRVCRQSFPNVASPGARSGMSVTVLGPFERRLMPLAFPPHLQIPSSRLLEKCGSFRGWRAFAREVFRRSPAAARKGDRFINSWESGKASREVFGPFGGRAVSRAFSLRIRGEKVTRATWCVARGASFRVELSRRLRSPSLFACLLPRRQERPERLRHCAGWNGGGRGRGPPKARLMLVTASNSSA